MRFVTKRRRKKCAEETQRRNERRERVYACVFTRARNAFPICRFALSPGEPRRCAGCTYICIYIYYIYIYIYTSPHWNRRIYREINHPPLRITSPRATTLPGCRWSSAKINDRERRVFPLSSRILNWDTRRVFVILSERDARSWEFLVSFITLAFLNISREPHSSLLCVTLKLNWKLETLNFSFLTFPMNCVKWIKHRGIILCTRVSTIINLIQYFSLTKEIYNHPKLL